MSSPPPGARKIRIVIVDDIAETRNNIRKLLYFEDDIEIIGTGSNGREGVEVATQLRPDIVLMDINMPGMDGIAASEAISREAPDAQVIMMSVQGESDYLRRSMLAGAREFLIKPFSSDELTTGIRRVYELAATRRSLAPAAPPPPASSSVLGEPPNPSGAKVIALYSPKGGSGVSTIAVNLAIALKEELKARVAVMDTSLQFGDTGLLLNLTHSRSIYDISAGKQEIDEDLLNSVLAVHASGVKVLLPPPRPELAELVTADTVKTILKVLAKMFDYVVVDTGRTINDVLLAVLDNSEQILLVTGGDIATLKSSKLFFDVTDALAYPPGKTTLVVNKEDGRSMIPLSDIETNLKHSISATLPRDDKTTGAALNRGIPFIISQRGSPLSAGLIHLAHNVARAQAVPVSAAAAAPLAPVPIVPPISSRLTSAPAGATASVAAPPRRASGLRRFFSFGRK